MEEKDYSKSYSEKGLWDKISKNVKSIGKEALINALKLYYAMALGKANPAQVAAIIGALGYLISPIDAIPDITPVIGYADDGGLLTAAVATLACCADPEVNDAAKAKVSEWFD